MSIKHLFFALGVSLLPGPLVHGSEKTLPSLNQAQELKSNISSRETQVDFTSTTTGRTYRVMIAAPYNMDTKKSYPVVYLLDGYWYFRPAVDFTTEAGDRLQSPIVVGIGYPTENYQEHCDRRVLDLSVPATSAKATDKKPPGDCDAFLRMIHDEIKPYVERKFPVDRSRQTLYGKSFGGITVLRELFRHPENYQTYVAASPAIFWNDKAVLGDESAFSKQAKQGKLKLKLLITTAGDEQYRGTDPKLLERARRGRMIDNAAELAGRLKGLDEKNVVVNYTLFPDESHFSVSLSCLGRGLSFALPVEAK